MNVKTGMFYISVVDLSGAARGGIIDESFWKQKPWKCR